MQYAILDGKIVEAGKDAPKEARCVYCGERVILRDMIYPDYYAIAYIHACDDPSDCLNERDKAQKELDKILGIER